MALLKKDLSESSDLDREIAFLERRKLKLEKLLRLRSEVAQLETFLSSGRVEFVKVMKGITVEVGAHFGLSPELICSHSRAGDVALARQLVYYLARVRVKSPCAVIGRFLNRDHGAVLHGVRAIRDRIETDPKFAERVRVIEGCCAQHWSDHDGTKFSQ